MTASVVRSGRSPRLSRREPDQSLALLSSWGGTLCKSVREDWSHTHRTLLRLGEVSELRSSRQIDLIIRALRAYAEGTWFEAGELSGEGAPSFDSTGAVRSCFRRLGLDEHVSSIGGGRTRDHGWPPT